MFRWGPLVVLGPTAVGGQTVGDLEIVSCLETPCRLSLVKRYMEVRETKRVVGA